MTCPKCRDFRSDTGPRFRCYFCQEVFCEDCAEAHFTRHTARHGLSVADLEHERRDARQEAARAIVLHVPRYFVGIGQYPSPWVRAPADAEGDHLWVKWADVKAALKDV